MRKATLYFLEQLTDDELTDNNFKYSTVDIRHASDTSLSVINYMEGSLCCVLGKHSTATVSLVNSQDTLTEILKETSVTD